MTDMNFAKIRNKVGAIAVIALLLCSNALGVGDTPISGLRLTSPANGGWMNFTNLNFVISSNIVSSNLTVSTLTVGGTTITNLSTLATWGAVGGTITNQTDLWGYLSWLQANTNSMTVNGGFQTTNSPASVNYLQNYQSVTNLIATLAPIPANIAFTTSNNTYAAGTTQAMAMATVTNNATTGTQVVNYQTMTSQNYAVRSAYNVFTASNRFEGPIDAAGDLYNVAYIFNGYNSGYAIDMWAAKLNDGSSYTLDWKNRSLTGGVWTVTTDATQDKEIVNYQTMTGQNYAVRSAYNEFTSDNTFLSTISATNDGRSVWGSSMNIASIDSGAYGAVQRGYIDNPNVSSLISGYAYGAEQAGYIMGFGSTNLIRGSSGAMQRGLNQGGYSAIDNSANGALQCLWNNYGRAVIDNGYGAVQFGFIDGGVATNQGNGAMQLLCLTSGQRALTTYNGKSSLLLGAGTASNKNAIVAGDNQVSHGNGSITAGGGFWTTNSLAADNWAVNWQTMTNAIATLSPPTVGAAYLASNNIYSAGTTQAMAMATVTNTATTGTQVVNYQTMTNAIATMVPTPTLQTVLNNGNTASTSLFLTNAANVIGIGATNQNSAKLYVKGDNGPLTNAPLVLIEGSVGRNYDFLQITSQGGTFTNTRVLKDGSLTNSVSVSSPAGYFGNMNTSNWNNAWAWVTGSSNNVQNATNDSIQTVVDRGNSVSNSIVLSNANGYAVLQDSRMISGYGLNITNVVAAGWGNAQFGWVQYPTSVSARITSSCNGMLQFLNIVNSNSTVTASGVSAGIQGLNMGVMNPASTNTVIMQNAWGCWQLGDVDGGRAFLGGKDATFANRARGSVQLLSLTNNQVATNWGKASIGMGATIVTNDQALAAGDGQVSHGNGSITAGGGFWDNEYRLDTNLLVWISSNTNNVQSSTNDTLQTVLTRGNVAATSVFLTNAASVIAVGATNKNSAKLYVKGDNGTLTNVPLVLIEGSVGRNFDFFQITGSGGTVTNTRVLKDGSFTNSVSVNTPIANVTTGNFTTVNIGGYNADTIYYTNQTYSMVSTNTTNFVWSAMGFNVPNIVRGRIYVADTNAVTIAQPYSKTATLTFRNTQVRASGEAIWQADMLMSAVLINSNMTVGATSVYVGDATDFSANNLVYLTGLTNEFARVLSISGNNLILKYGTTASHVIGNGCTRVREFGGFKTYDASLSKTIWGSVDFTGNTTVNLKMDLEYGQ